MMVELMAPGPDEVICDPACGTSGFLVAAGVMGLVPENVRLRLREKYARGEVRRGTPCLAAPHGGFRVS